MIFRGILFGLLLSMSSLALAQPGTSPVRDPEMKKFLESRLETLRQSELKLAADAASQPPNSSLQSDLSATREEIKWLEQSIGTPGTVTPGPSVQPMLPSDASNALLYPPGGMGGRAMTMPPLNPPPATSVSPNMPPSSIPSLMAGMSPQMLQPIKDGLMAELKNMQGILSMVDPNDTQFLSQMQARQAEILNQIKDIDLQMQGASTPPLAPTAPIGISSPLSPVEGYPKNLQSTGTLVTGILPQNAQISEMQSAAQQLRAAGQPQLADQVLREMEQLKTQIPTPTPTMPQPTAYIPDTASFTSPWMPQPSKEIVELKTTVESLRSEIEKMRTDMKALETQLQLLNRNTVHEAGRLDQVLIKEPIPVVKE